MPIYSNNRTGSMALAQVAANESYTSEDFGRILYESQLNDMAFFEAVLTCDFKEIKGLREGTILEAEVAALNEATLKELGKNLVERLKELWAKIKGWFKDVKQKFAAWVLKDGKALVAECKKVDFSSWEGSIEKVRTFNYNDECLNIMKTDWSKSIKDAYANDSANTATIVSTELGKLVNKDSVSSREYTAEAMKICMVEKDLDKSTISDFMAVVDKASTHIKFLNNYQKMCEGRINTCIKDITSEAEKDGSAAKLNGIVHAYEMILATMTKAAIAVTKADMKSRASALRKALASAKFKSVKEAVDIEGQCVCDAFDEAMNRALIMDADTQAAVTALIASC